MKRNSFVINPSASSISLLGRIAAVLVLLLMGVAAGRAQTQQQVVFPLTGFTIADNLAQSGSSPSLLPAAAAYSYVISGTVHGTGYLTSVIPPGTTLAAAVNTMDPGFSSNLQGTVVNPGGALPFYLLTNKTAAGTLAGGLVSASATFNLWVDASGSGGTSGRANFSITNVSFLVLGSSNSSTIVFDSGSVTTTAVLTPVTVTGTASSVTGTSATLNASVNPNGDNATVVFNYGLTNAYGSTTTAQVVPEGIGAVPVTANISGLQSGTTYHFQVTGSNSTGMASGADSTFTTVAPSGGPPIATTGTATNIQMTSATVNGLVNPNGLDTTVTFQYGLTTAYTGTTSAQDIGSGTSALPVNAPLASLTPGMLYHFQVTGSNSQGVTPGGDQTFMTAASGSPPAAATGIATNIGLTAATLNGSVNPNGLDTSVTFQYGLTSTYTGTTSAQDIGSGTAAMAVNAPIAGLTPGMTYHFQLTGSNSQGVTPGGDQTFMTSAAIPPTVTTDAATNITSTTATLNGSVNANGTSTSALFEYGLDTGYGTMTPVVVETGTVPSAISANLTGLQPGATYHFAAVGASTSGTSPGTDLTFTTNFVFPNVAGKYQAALSGTSNATSGMAKIKVTSNGSFSASLDLAGSTVSFSGNLAISGSGMATKSGYTLQLQLASSSGTNSIAGAVTGLQQLNFVAPELVTTATPQSYTVRLTQPVDTSLPQGFGYATMTVATSGAIHVAGKLGDGTSFMASSGRLSNGTVPLYVPLYHKMGCIVGTITFETTVNGDLDGPVTWIKPQTTGAYDPMPFLTPVNLYGSIYVKPASGFTVFGSTNATAEVVGFEDGNLAVDGTANAVTLTNNNKITFSTAPADKLTMTITPSTGLFSGSFKPADPGPSIKFKGAIFQGALNFGVGEFKGTTEPGSVVFNPGL